MVHRGVTPVISTLILVAIAGIGGTMISLFSEDIMISAQVSGNPIIESLEIIGYDASDTQELRNFDDQFLETYSGGIADGIKSSGERITVFVQNNSIQQVFLNEVRFAGTVYAFSQNVSTLQPYFLGTAPARGEYAILLKGPDQLLNSPVPVIEPGQTVTLVIGLDDNIKIGRDAQTKITTNQGFVMVGTTNVGDHRS